MDTLLEMRTAIQSDLNVSSTSSLFPPTTIDLAINRSYIKAGALCRWPALEDARKTSAKANQNYYDAPSTWRPDSIFRLEVDGELYGEDPDGSPMDYNDFLTWKIDYPNSTEKKWAVQWLRYFISPTPTADGNANISVWGMENVETLADDDDTTIFSYNLPDCNEAIVEEAKAILKHKGDDDKGGQFFSVKAKETLMIAFNKIRQEQAKYEKVQPFFYVEDMFSGKSNLEEQITGGF